MNDVTRGPGWKPNVDDEIDLRADVGRQVEQQQQLAELERILSTLSTEQLATCSFCSRSNE